MPKTEDGLTDKLHALNMLAKYVGLVAVGPLRRTEAAKAAAETFVTDEVLVQCFCVMLDTAAHPVARAACAALVRCRFPDWRERVPKEVLGFVVERNSPEVANWRSAVLMRDGNACQKCGAKSHLHAHHIVRWADSPELRVVVENGITLCQLCHVEEHHGRPN